MDTSLRSSTLPDRGFQVRIPEENLCNHSTFNHIALGGALLLALLGAPSASAQTATSLATRAAPALGTFLTDQAGKTLYIYTKDDVGISNCYDSCAAAWPPLMTQADPVLPANLPGMVGTTQRTDGGVQVTYNGMPLYYWAKDLKPLA